MVVPTKKNENHLVVQEPEKGAPSSSSHVRSATISDADIWNDDTWGDNYGSNNISTTSAYSASAPTITGCTINGKIAEAGSSSYTHSTALVVHPDHSIDSKSNISSTVERIGYVGLSNQGATCYMNSLLQALYMTPEFRRALYTWNYDKEKDGSEEHSIPLQLQKLFGMLQLSKCRDIDTKALTKSFGWEGGEVFQQQDIQELCRVLFDALEVAFKGTEVQNVIDDIYAGELIDYVKCLDIDVNSERVDKVQDFSLAIRPFGSDVPVKSLTEAIELFLRPEILDGENQYYAESVQKKVDAIKGLKIGKIPYALTFQLKRFVYDFSSGDIVQKKLNDAVSFPMYLDMNKYVGAGKDFDNFLRKEMSTLRRVRSENMFKNKEQFENGDLSENIDRGDDEMPKTYTTTIQSNTNSTGTVSDNGDNKLVHKVSSNQDDINHDEDDDDSLPDLVERYNADVLDEPPSLEAIEAPQDKEKDVCELHTREEAIDAIEKNGEWVYELFAVLIHSGAIYGGHYYAYIKDMDSGKWLNFNDSSVSEIEASKVKETWGQASSSSSMPNSYYSSYQNSANAYMLQYRKLNANRDSTFKPSSSSTSFSTTFPSDDMIPQYIQDAVKTLEEERKEKERLLQERLDQLSIKVNFRGKEISIKTNKKSKLHEFYLEVCRTFKLNEDDILVEGGDSRRECDLSDDVYMEICKKHLRLRALYYKNVQEAYSYEEQGQSTLKDLGWYECKNLLLETKKEEDIWEPYCRDDINLNLYEYDENSKEFKPPRAIRINQNILVGDMRKKIASKYVDYSVDDVCMVKLTTVMNDIEADEIVHDVLPLKRYLMFYSIHTTYNLYWEKRSTEPRNPSFIFNCVKAKQRELNRITLVINVSKLLLDPEFADINVQDPSTEISADKTTTIKEFRQLLIDKFDIPQAVQSKFKILKFHYQGEEINDHEKMLNEIQIHTMCKLFLVPGEPIKSGHIYVKLYLYKKENNIPSTVASSFDAVTHDGAVSTAISEAIPIQDNCADDSLTVAEAYFSSSRDNIGTGVHVENGVDCGSSNTDETDNTNTATMMLSSSKEGSKTQSESIDPTLEAYANDRVKFNFPDHCFTYISQVQVKTSYPATVAANCEDLQKNIYEKLISSGHISSDVPITRIRIREKMDQKLNRIIRADTLLREFHLFTNKEFAVQVLDENEDLLVTKDQVLVYVREFERSRWALSEQQERVVKLDSKVCEIGQELAAEFNIQDATNLRVLYLPSNCYVNIKDLHRDAPLYLYKWANINGNERILKDYATGISDGHLIIVQDVSEDLRKFTSEEIDTINSLNNYSNPYYFFNTSSYGTSNVNSSDVANKNYSTYKRPAEQGIKIKTQKDRENEKLKSESSSTDLTSSCNSVNGNGLSIDAAIANANVHTTNNYIYISGKRGNSPTGTSDGIALFSDIDVE